MAVLYVGTTLSLRLTWDGYCTVVDYSIEMEQTHQKVHPEYDRSSATTTENAHGIATDFCVLFVCS